MGHALIFIVVNFDVGKRARVFFSMRNKRAMNHACLLRFAPLGGRILILFYGMRLLRSHEHMARPGHSAFLPPLAIVGTLLLPMFASRVFFFFLILFYHLVVHFPFTFSFLFLALASSCAKCKRRRCSMNKAAPQRVQIIFSKFFKK